MHVFFSKSGLAGAVAALALLGAGCASTIMNMTSETMAENPSQIYTITARVKPVAAGFMKQSLKVQIVIDGQLVPMKPSALGNDIFEYEYTIPPGRTEAVYYLLVNYQTENNGYVSSREEYTGTKHLKLLNRYVYTLDSVRGPIGSRIAVLGRGFTPQDVVYLEGTPMRTVYESPNSLAFTVPAVPAGRNYGVTLNSPTGSQPIGTFHVDGLSLTVMPTELALHPGEKASLLFTVNAPAPAGGLLIDVTTNVPKSVVMPEVIIPGGATSVSVTVQGGQSGSGNLFVSGAGSGEITVPISVTAR